MDEVDFSKYVQGFAQQLVDSYSHGSDSIRLHFEVNAVVGLDQATPCALIIKELLSNALKFAFHESKQGNIWIKFVQQDQNFTLEVRDDGIGILPDFSLTAILSLGLQQVTELAAQLNGSLCWANDGGAVFSVKFPCRQGHPAGKVASELVTASAANRHS